MADGINEVNHCVFRCLNTPTWHCPWSAFKMRLYVTLESSCFAVHSVSHRSSLRVRMLQEALSAVPTCHGTGSTLWHLLSTVQFGLLAFSNLILEPIH